MTRDGLWHRFNDLRERLYVLAKGLPQGGNVFVDIDRRLTRTSVETIFDVGANRGQSARAFRRWYPHATIHCFEPVPDTYALLQKATAGLAVHTHPIGFSRMQRMAEIATSPDGDSMATLAGDTPGARTTSVNLDTIDDFCERHAIRQIDYLKIDTEGHDLDVLGGSTRMLQSGAAALIQVEAGLHPDNRFHVPASELSGCLLAYGYRLFGVYEQTLEWTTADAYLRRADLVFVAPDVIGRNRYQSHGAQRSPA